MSAKWVGRLVMAGLVAWTVLMAIFIAWDHQVNPRPTCVRRERKVVSLAGYTSETAVCVEWEVAK